MMHNFLYVSKIMDCDNTIYLWPHVKTYILKVYFKINTHMNKIFQHCFMVNLDHLLKEFHINK